MSVEEEVELRDMVTQTLELNGCLPKIRAQLRASLFLALDEDSKVNTQKPLLNNKIKSFLEIPEGHLMFCIVREFLEFFNLDFTISVYEPESYLGSHYKYEGRNKIIEDLGIKNLDNDDAAGPVLFNLVKIAQAKSKTLEINLNINNNNDDEIRETISSNNTTSEVTSNGIDNNNLSHLSNNASPITNGVNHEDNDDNEPNSLNSTYIKKSPSSEEDAPNKSVEGTPPLVSKDQISEQQQSSSSKKGKVIGDLPRVSDILPSLYNKEFKEKNNLKELDKLFDMNAEYEEDFMSPSEIDLSSNKGDQSTSLMEELESSKGLTESKINDKNDNDTINDLNESISLSIDSSNHLNQKF